MSRRAIPFLTILAVALHVTAGLVHAQQDNAEVRNLRAALEASQKANAALQKQLQESQAKAAELARDAELTKAKAEIAELKAKAADLEAKRLRAEVDALDKVARDRQASIFAALKDARNQKLKEITLEAESAMLRSRTEQLMREVQRVDQRVAELEAKGGQAKVIPVNGADPSPMFIKGKVTKVDADNPRRVVISVGKDAGLEVGDTFEVYRTLPEVRFLGMVRITDVQPTTAVAERIGPNAAKTPLREGDQVARQLK